MESDRVQARASTLLIGVGVLMVCLAIPATLVGAQAPAPAAGPDPGQVVVPPEPAEPPAQPPPPQAPPPGTDPPAPGPPPAPPEPDQPAPPAPVPVDESGATVIAARSVSVAILDGNQASAFVFSPSSVSVATGDTVTWNNQGSAPEGHDVTGDGLASGNLQQGQSYSHTFASAGTFNYICSLHPFMKGSVTVAGGGGSGAGGTGDDPSSAQDGSTATAPGSESAAVTSPGAAGSTSQLPSSGMPVWPLLGIGIGFLLGGVLLRRRALSSAAS
jgi:plastocyanin